MPPANSLQDTPSLSPVAPASTVQPSAPSTLPLLPNLTIDLVNRTEHEDEDVHDDNVNFLRTNSRSSPDFSLSHQRRRRQQQLAETESDQMDLDHRWGVGLNADFGSHIRWLDRHSDELSRLPNYEGRTPELRSLYGWAPDDVEDPAISLLQEWTADDTGVGHNSTSRRHARREPSGRASSHQPTDGGSNSNHRPIGTIVPTETLLQSVRRHPRFSRARTLHHYLLERDRDRDRESEDRDRSATRAYRFVPTSRSEIRNLSQHNDLRSRPSAHRQMCLDHPPSPRLKETIKYLDHLRDSCTLEERITSAAAIGYFHLDYFPRDEDDFILDTASIAPPAECSWLKPGMVFSGSQRAARTSGSIFSHHPHTPNDPVIVNGSEPGRPTVHTFSGRQYLPQNIYRLGSNKDENWPVKVTIHSINYNEMTLTGTMEAYNIPDKTTTTPDAHIITFLEGEIIDFNQYTLETGKFRADTETDSTYWRELQPFKDLTDDEMVKNLVSKKWITEELSNQWILMRWKEQCFVTPPRDSQSRQSLTISGFYYICLRRDSGHIEGLYYDPVSSPYQQLSLHPQSPRMICPSYKFR